MRGLEGGIWTKYHSCVATRQVPTLPGEHPPGVPREDQANKGSRASELADLAGVAHWDGHQAHQEQASGRDHATNGPWCVGTGREAAAALARGHGPQHSLYRALECNLSRTTGELDAQIS